MKYTETQQQNFRYNMAAYINQEGISGADFAGLIGVTPNYVSKIKRGFCDASERVVADFCNLAGCSEKEALSAAPFCLTADKVEYGKRLRRARTAMGLSVKTVASYAGFYTPDLYREVESGKALSVTPKQQELLNKLLFPEVNVLAEEKPEPEKVTDETAEKTVVTVEIRTEASIPSDIVELLLDHVKDLKVSGSEQRRIFRTLAEYQMKMKEEELFGKEA